MALGRRIVCPLLALWSAEGGLATWYEDEGGPLQLWRQWCDDVSGHPVDGGHFFPEEHPAETAATLEMFFGGDADQNR
jgi:haloacetate dehalogenase